MPYYTVFKFTKFTRQKEVFSISFAIMNSGVILFRSIYVYTALCAQSHVMYKFIQRVRMAGLYLFNRIIFEVNSIVMCRFIMLINSPCP